MPLELALAAAAAAAAAPEAVVVVVVAVVAARLVLLPLPVVAPLLFFAAETNKLFPPIAVATAEADTTFGLAGAPGAPSRATGPRAAATSAAAGKFALRSTLELCVRAVNGRAQLPAWKLLLETLAKPTGSRKAVLGVQEAQELFKELQRHAGAARHTCQPLMTRPLAAKTSGPPRFNTGGRRRCCGPPPPQSLCHV